MAGVNKAILIGNLGRDPEIRYTQSGMAVANFSIATSESWNDRESGQKQERTEWHRIVVFGKQGENCGKYLSKGSKVYIEGRISYGSYEREGVKHYTTDIIGFKMILLSGSETRRPADESSYGTQHYLTYDLPLSGRGV